MGETVIYTMESPLGRLHLHATRGVPVGLSFVHDDRACAVEESPPPPAVETLVRAVESYFRGEEIGGAVIEELLGYLAPTEFEQAVLREVALIPRGDTASYGEVAERAGYPRAARAVGNVMHTNPYPIIIPCHRVIRSDGNLGGYGGAENIKAWLLRFEGHVISGPDNGLPP